VYVFKAEIQRTRQEMESSVERGDRQREALQQKMVNAEKDYQMALQRAKLAHDDDVTRLSEAKVIFVQKLGRLASLASYIDSCMCRTLNQR